MCRTGFLNIEWLAHRKHRGRALNSIKQPLGDAWLTHRMCQRASNKRGESRCMCQQQQLSQTASVAHEKKKSVWEHPIERASHSESLCWVFWHCCRWETRRRGSEARWSGTQESPEFRTSFNCGCGVEEVLTFYWFIYTHASLGSYIMDQTFFSSLIWLKYICLMLRILEQILRLTCLCLHLTSGHFLHQKWLSAQIIVLEL